jgi:hypothetical protein
MTSTTLQNWHTAQTLSVAAVGYSCDCGEGRSEIPAFRPENKKQLPAYPGPKRL